MREARSHRREDKLSGVVNEGPQPSWQVDALGTGLHTMVEDLDEVLQAVLVHGVYEGQVSHDKVKDGTTLWDSLVLLSGRLISASVCCASLTLFDMTSASPHCHICMHVWEI